MSVVIMILLLSLLIFVHELGHFAAARMFGIGVDRFAFGMPVGPVLWQKKFGETTYLIHAFLLGGYVTFADDNEELNLPEDSPKRYSNKPIWQKMTVISSGVIMNLICAFVSVLLAASVWGNLPSGESDVYIKNIVAPKEASVWTSGLEPGDRVVEINGSVINTAYGLNWYAQSSKAFDGKVNETAVEDNYLRLKKQNQAFERNEIIPADILVRLPELTDEAPIHLSENSLRGFEVIKFNEVSLNEKQVKLRDEIQNKKYFISDGNITLNDVAYAMSDGLKPLEMKVERAGKILDLKTIYPNKEGIIGIELDPKEILIPTKSVKSIVTNSYNHVYNTTSYMLIMFKNIFTGQLPIKNLMGIVQIAKVGGDIIKEHGIYHGLLLAAMISINLAILNFLPIPALDGGHFMFLVIEKITGRPLKENTLNAISNIFFWLLILLLLFLVFNDILVLLKG